MNRPHRTGSRGMSAAERRATLNAFLPATDDDELAGPEWLMASVEQSSERNSTPRDLPNGCSDMSKSTPPMLQSTSR